VTPAALRERLRLYAITPDSLDTPAEYADACAAALRGGVTAIQYRDKRPDPVELREARATAVRDACRAAGALFVVNDDPRLAARLGADGVHLGPDDAEVAAARLLLGPDVLIGGSAGTPERACALVVAGVDYLGVGAIFDARATKANASAPRGIAVLSDVRAAVGALPIVAIGGIAAENAASCLLAGADGVATVRGVFGGGDPASAARALRRALDEATPQT
jgi:thiamine-phosphate pyrophosphorylase